MQLLHDDENVNIAIIEKPDSNRVTLALASADLRFHGMDLPSAEFVKSAESATTIFIIDKKMLSVSVCLRTERNTKLLY